jgi:hypothetical protein
LSVGFNFSMRVRQSCVSSTGEIKRSRSFRLSSQMVKGNATLRREPVSSFIGRMVELFYLSIFRIISLDGNRRQIFDLNGLFAKSWGISSYGLVLGSQKKSELPLILQIKKGGVLARTLLFLI